MNTVIRFICLTCFIASIFACSRPASSNGKLLFREDKTGLWVSADGKLSAKVTSEKVSEIVRYSNEQRAMILLSNGKAVHCLSKGGNIYISEPQDIFKSQEYVSATRHNHL